MSAWIVTKKHIDTLVCACFRYEIDTYSVRTADEIGQLLWKENHRSINYAYNKRLRTPKYLYFAQYDSNLMEVVRDPIALHKAIECYRYQACERDDWIKSKAQKLTHELQEATLKSTKLTEEEMFDHPRWDAAPWGIREHDVPWLQSTT